jgi:GTP-binding protein
MKLVWESRTLSPPFTVLAQVTCLDAIVAHLPRVAEEADADVVRIAIVGRPNVGRVIAAQRAALNEDRTIVSPIAGTTRDAIDSELTWDDQRLVLVDTAGIRRRGKVEKGVEIQRTEGALCH